MTERLASCSGAGRILLAMLAIVGVAVGCRSSARDASGPSLLGTSWRALEIGERGVLERVASTLSFEPAGRIAGHTACNRYFGEAEIGNGTIRLKPTGTTRMACAPEVMDQEQRFVAALSAATRLRRERDQLLLLDDAGRVQLRLAPAR